MKLLVIGSGGREHALAWKLAQSPKVSQVYVAPGNGGTATESGLLNVPISAIPALVEFARREEIALTVVGPEAPLAAGVVDAFRAAGLKIFGPSAAAAQLESSKDFAKQFMARHGIPTAAFGTFTDAAAAHAYIDEHGAVGEEASFIVMVDGEHVLALASSQDHKRLGDGDSGPNTGGMGAYSPAPVVTPELHARIMREVIHPTVEGMAADGIRYTGFLYAGIMVGADGAPRVLEFNCRMGDPETQPIMMRLKSDLSVLLDAGVNGKLDQVEAEWDRRAALGVVIAAAGYPASPQQGAIVGTLPAAADDLHIFHAGTTAQDERIVVSGGRVLVVTALGDSVRLAQKRAYEAIADVRFDGMQYRRDIGWRALDRKK
ncbi:MAG: phosphoribosylamine--glycine ligase [Thiobacillus sp.]|nr:phosphoribosylamine--glycine ligase [Thiobacillus sp.]